MSSNVAVQKWDPWLLPSRYIHFTVLRISDFILKVHCARCHSFLSRGLNSFTEWPKFSPKSHYCWHRNFSWNVTKTFIFFLPLQLQTAPYFDTFLFQILFHYCCFRFSLWHNYVFGFSIGFHFRQLTITLFSWRQAKILDPGTQVTSLDLFENHLNVQIAFVK